MANVSIRDLRNHGGEIVDRAARGEQLTITRSGRPVALLTSLRREPARLDALITRRQQLPRVDTTRFRLDIDEILDTSL